VRDDIGPYFTAKLDKLVAEHPLVGERRGVGLMASLQLVRDKATRELCTMEDNAAIQVRETCYANGLIVRAVMQSIVLSPPLVITRDEVDELINILTRALDEAARKLGKL
jgi:putrescine aminotransferase